MRLEEREHFAARLFRQRVPIPGVLGVNASMFRYMRCADANAGSPFLAEFLEPGPLQKYS